MCWRLPAYIRYCPGDGRYEITSPVFDRVEFRLDPAYAAGGSFVIEARDNSPENIYIQSATLNGKKYDKCYLTHDDLAAGGTLVLKWGLKTFGLGKVDQMIPFGGETFSGFTLSRPEIG